MSSNLPPHVLRYGVDAPLPEQIALRAGPLSLMYEAGDLRYIRFGEREIVRRLYVAVRDHNWNTIPAVLSDVHIVTTIDSFQITYTAEHQQGSIDFVWRGTITGDARGTIIFRMDGTAHSTFLKNRIGFCVLHPMRECAGTPCRVEHVDGAVTESTFPYFISPHQPFMQMRAISYEVANGVEAEVRFDGDIFEMEDQRNWTDASFKTYSTPLDLPYPVEVAAGTHIEQSVTLTLHGAWHDVLESTPPQTITFSFDEQAARPLPQIGIGSASHEQPLSAYEIDHLKALHLAHLRVDLDLLNANCEQELARAVNESHMLGVPLEIALTVSNNADDELRVLFALLQRLQPHVCRWLIFHADEQSTSAKWVELARTRLTSYDPDVPFGAGAAAYFTELNRFRSPAEALDIVCYSLNPQVHAFDNASLAETLPAQAATIASARHLYPNQPIAITPITLKPRFNPNATGPEPEPAPGDLPPQVDVRQMSLFGAGWTLGSMKYLAESGAGSVTYYETSGWRGVMETKAGPLLPSRFRSIPSAVFPLYHVLADVGDYAGGNVVPMISSNPLLVEGLMLRAESRTRVMLANLSHASQTVILHIAQSLVHIHMLDETNAEHVMRFPEAFRAAAGVPTQTVNGTLKLAMLPYAVARVDL